MSDEQVSQKSPNDLVVIGSSAGGIEALSILVSTLNENFPAPLVIAQHLDPSRPSSLGAILERRGKLPVVLVKDKAHLEKGKVYVVPSNHHVKITDSYVALEEDLADRPRPSVDLLLSSAAEYYGEHLIAVILTGTGSDGAAGAIEVKKAGGTIIIQNPETARYPSMPLALPPTAVDHVADIEHISDLLFNIVKGVPLSIHQEESDGAIREILRRVNNRSNIDFRPYKPATLLRRISRRMAVTHNATIEAYSRYLDLHPEEVGELTMALLIKVTEFFRDFEAFSYIKNSVLPELVERGRGRGRALRMWSAGCATGEEPYSLAFLLADELGAELPEWNIKIFATDIDEGAINFARRGLYSSNVLENLPDAYRARFFEPAEQGYRVTKPLRQMIIFGHQDLSRGAPFPRIDLVACRNLLIYFNPKLQQDVLDLFAYSLCQVNGYLFLGKAETAQPLQSHYEMINKRWKVYRCLSNPVPKPLLLGGTNAHHLARHVAASRAASSAEKQALDAGLSSQEAEVGQLQRFNEMVLRHLHVGVVVIDDAYRVVTANSTGRAANHRELQSQFYEVDRRPGSNGQTF